MGKASCLFLSCTTSIKERQLGSLCPSTLIFIVYSQQSSHWGLVSIFKRSNLLCNVMLYSDCLHLYATTGVQHNMWGKELLSKCTFLVRILIMIITIDGYYWLETQGSRLYHQYRKQAKNQKKDFSVTSLTPLNELWIWLFSLHPCWRGWPCLLSLHLRWFWLMFNPPPRHFMIDP